MPLRSSYLSSVTFGPTAYHFGAISPCFIVDRLGSVFAPVKSDIGGNIQKLKKALEKNADKRSIQMLIVAEKAAGKHKDATAASSALLWFSR
jgi:hypothetical protein